MCLMCVNNTLYFSKTSTFPLMVSVDQTSTFESIYLVVSDIYLASKCFFVMTASSAPPLQRENILAGVQNFI